MLCPKCNMNIKDDVKICIFCGASIDTVNNTSIESSSYSVCPKCNSTLVEGNHFCTNCGYRVTDTEINDKINQNVNNNSEKVEVKDNSDKDKEKYYQAYFNNKYEKVKNSSFSFGVLLFEWVWLCLYRLYSDAIRMFVSVFVAQVIGGFIGGTLVMGGKSILLGGLIMIGCTLVVSVSYARDFSNLRLQKAKEDIDKVLGTTFNEEDRINACKREGRLNYLFLILVVINIFSMISFVLNLFVGEENAKKEVINTSHEYVKLLQSEIDNKKIIPFDGEYDNNRDYYILVDSTSDRVKDYPLRLDNSNNREFGYIVISNSQFNKQYYVCLYNEENKLFTIGYDNELDSIEPIKDGRCNSRDIQTNYPDAMRLVLAD